MIQTRDLVAGHSFWSVGAKKESVKTKWLKRVAPNGLVKCVANFTHNIYVGDISVILQLLCSVIQCNISAHI